MIMSAQNVLADIKLGPETGLPIPRFISMKQDEGNMRVGPSTNYRIKAIYVRKGTPFQVTHEYGNWRKVIDPEGNSGWMHRTLMSNNRTIIVQPNMAMLHRLADADTPLIAMLEAGVIASLLKCDRAWCRIKAGKYEGWTPKAGLWGVMQH